jgi:hypothetical protein
MRIGAITYCFDSIEILTKDTNLGTIATADKEPYNLTAIGVETAIRSQYRSVTAYRGHLNTTASQVLGPHSCHGVSSSFRVLEVTP